MIIRLHISIEFPDLPGCLSCADTTEESVANAKEVLGLFLWGMDGVKGFLRERCFLHKPQS